MKIKKYILVIVLDDSNDDETEFTPPKVLQEQASKWDFLMHFKKKEQKSSAVGSISNGLFGCEYELFCFKILCENIL